MIMIGTVNAILRGSYFLPDGRNVHLDKKEMEKCAIQRTKMFSKNECQFDNMLFPMLGNNTEIIIVNGDCLEATLWLSKRELTSNQVVEQPESSHPRKHYKPVMLVNASASNPGGGYKTGASGQEENMHRRTNLFQCTEDPYKVDKNRQWDYPIPEFGGLYVKNATVFRGSEQQGYLFLERPTHASFIFISAYRSPPLEVDTLGQFKIPKKIAQFTKQKIINMFNIALANGYDSIVLGAFGCGVYQNPPFHIASLFFEVLHTEQFKNRFKCVIFAIVESKNIQAHNPQGNIVPFEQVFKVQSIKIEDLIQKVASKEPVIDEESNSKQDADSTDTPTETN